MSVADTIEDAIASHDDDEITAAVVGGVVLAILDSVNPQTVSLRSSTGAVAPEVAWDGRLWAFDPDSIAAHDGLTCIVTIDGDHYLTNDVKFEQNVISRVVTTPPDPDDIDPDARPDYGDQYLVPPGSTDDWSGHIDEIAQWTARDWVFHVPTAGEEYLVKDEGETGLYIHYNKDAESEDGLPGNLIDQSVRPSTLLIRAWQVENQTTTAPPATGPAGEQYIIGASATGLWAGKDGKIAWRPSTDATFEIATPFVGEEIWDKAAGLKYRWTGTAWVSAAGAIIGYTYASTQAASAGTITNPGTDYVYSDGTAPTASVNRTADPVTLTYAAKSISNKLRIKYRAHCTFGAASFLSTFGILRSAENDAVAWDEVSVEASITLKMIVELTFLITPTNTLSQTYKLVGYENASGTQRVTAFSHRLFEIEEIVP